MLDQPGEGRAKARAQKRKKIKRRGAVAITPANNGRKAPPAVKIARTTPLSNLPFVKFIAEGLKRSGRSDPGCGETDEDVFARRPS